MIIRLNAAMRRRGHQERGAATLETVGTYLVVALLAVALLVAAVSSSPVVADKFRQAVCMVVTLGQGPCEASVTADPERKPPEPCVLTAQGHTASIEGAAVISLGANESFLVERLSDGRFRVTRGIGASVGVPTGQGFNISATHDNATVGVAEGWSANIAATFGGGQVYYAKNKDEVGDLLKAHKYELAKIAAGATGLPGIIALGFMKASGQDREFPEPEERYYEVGVAAGADAYTADLLKHASAGVTAQAVLGFRVKRDDSTTTYVKLSADANLSASALAGLGKANLGGQGEGIVELDRDSKGNITAVRLKTAMAGTAQVAVGPNGPDLSHYSETELEVPINTENNKKIAQLFLKTAGLGDVEGFSGLAKLGQTTPDQALGAAKAFGEAAAKLGRMKVQEFENDKSSTDELNIDGEWYAKLGLNIKVDHVDRTSKGVSLWDGERWAPQKACGEQ